MAACRAQRDTRHSLTIVSWLITPGSEGSGVFALEGKTPMTALTTRRGPEIAVPGGFCSPRDRMAGRCAEDVRNWFRVENVAADTTADASGPVDIVIDGPIVDPVMADLFGIGVSSAQVVEQIRAFQGRPLNIWISSEGGLITAGLAIYGQIRMHDAPVTVIAYGGVMSIASVIAMAGDTLVMAPHSFLFIHETRGDLIDGTPADFAQQSVVLDQLAEEIAGVYASRGDSRVNWRAKMQAGSGDMQGTLITAEEAVRLKLANRVDTQIARQPTNKIDLASYGVNYGVIAGAGASFSRNLGGPADLRAEAVAVHHTDTTDAAWDDAAARKNARSGEDESYYRDIFAWQDPGKDPATKDAWSFTHHMVAADGTPGDANLTACSTGIGTLNGGRIQPGDDTPWMKDRQGIWDHLAAHLRDGHQDDPNYEPPPLKDEVADGATDDAAELFTIRDAEQALRDKARSKGLGSNEAKARAQRILAKGWQETDWDDPPPSSGMDEPKPEAEEPPTAAALALASARQWEALYVPMLGLTPMTKG